MNKTTIIVLFLVIIGVFFYLVRRGTRLGFAAAPYRVVRVVGEFELRDYPSLKVVEAPMVGEGDQSRGSFNRLFRFISGGNDKKQKIAMTTPVFFTGSASERAMAFVLPEEVAHGEVPRPTDSSLSIQEMQAGRFAVIRFRGPRRPEIEASALKRLEEWMQTEHLAEGSAPINAYFDPPWIPGFLKRNEVMVKVRD